MLKKLTPSDYIMLNRSIFFISFFGTYLWFKGEKEAAIFVGLMGSFNPRICIFLKLINQFKMIDIIPYFAAFITILFGVGFVLY